jgi:hypothetical protein
MKLLSVTEMGPVEGLCCRQAPLRGAVGALIFAAILVGLVFLTRHAGMPWFVWGGCAVLACLVIPVLIRDALARFRPTNWVLRADPDGLWINLLSFRKQPAAGAATVVRVNYDEIDHAHRHIDTWTTPMPKPEGGSTYWKLETLALHLVSDDTRDLARALAAAGAADPGAYPSVTVPAPGILRIAWRGAGFNHGVVPALDRVLAEMRPRVTVTDATRTDRPAWSRLSDAELDELVEHLVRWGSTSEAVTLLTRRRGCSTNEANQHVGEVLARL